jgi:hypothetical protein
MKMEVEVLRPANVIFAGSYHQLAIGFLCGENPSLEYLGLITMIPNIHEGIT